MFQNTVQNFGLSVGLRMVGCTHVQFGTTKFKEILPKATNEDGVASGHKATGNTMVFVDKVKESYFVRCKGGRQGVEMGSLGETIHNDQNSGKAVAWR